MCSPPAAKPRGWVDQECLNQHVLKVDASTPQYGDHSATGHGAHRTDYTNMDPAVRCRTSGGLPDDSAQLGTGNDEIKPAKKVPSQAAMSGRIATYALLFMFAFTGLIIWIGS